MKIFITSLVGFLNSNSGICLADEGHGIYGNDNLLGGYRENIEKQFKYYIDLEINNELTPNAWKKKII
tara:strand:- start:480 stop:683 length:204 start_codon:yes stop_codon:yes gene_type:complete